ncbi:MAG TPA: flagellar basal body-associated FliL family protein [Gemmatimonadales bacterium]|nr:flagellar basal body-associated FliL family protein [Gemmatimonadales bacterium]
MAPVAPSNVQTIGLGVLALAIGAVIGTLFIGPRLRPSSLAAGAQASAAAPKKEEPARIFRLDNVIVNPAASQGQRFLIVSVAVEVRTPEAEAHLKESEVAFRDAVIGIVERMTLEQLSQTGARDSLRQILTASAIRFAHDSALHVYLPQFLIQ